MPSFVSNGHIPTTGRLTLGVVDVLDIVVILQGFDEAANETLRALGRRVDGDKLKGSLASSHAEFSVCLGSSDCCCRQ